MRNNMRDKTEEKYVKILKKWHGMKKWRKKQDEKRKERSAEKQVKEL